MTKKKINYTKIGIVSAFAFLAIVVLVEFLFSLSSKESLEAITNEMLSTKFIISKLVVAIFYGFFMVFIVKRKSKKLRQ